MKLAIPDLISNSYFPALAAAELGYFRREGLDIEVELIFPVDQAYRALRDGSVDFVAGAAHGALATFPEWRGVRLLAALAQGMYWFLVMRADLGIARGDFWALKGRRIGAAPWVEMGLLRLLAAAAVRALVAAQDALKSEPSRATMAATNRFPPREAALIADIVARDLPFYDASIRESSVTAINEFARWLGILDRDIPYPEIVATQFRHLWL
jgi:NitT/TauT family transport system substrate-binding protein